MRRLTAIVRPQRAEQICAALLEDPGVEDLTAAEVQGSGRHADPGARGVAELDLLPKVVLEANVAIEAVDRVVDLVVRLGRASRSGDGKILLRDCQQQIRF